MKRAHRERNIIQAIAENCNLNGKDIKRTDGSRRTSQLVQARQMYAYILWEEFNYTFLEVKDAIGYKSHASAMHSKKMHEVDYFHNKRYRKMYDSVVKELNIEDKSENAYKIKIKDLEETIKYQEKRIKELLKLYQEK